MFKFLLLTFVSFTLITNVLSANKSISVEVTQIPPKLDGKLDDICWQNVKWYNNFSILNNPAKTPLAQTAFKLVHDNRSLYIIAKLDEPLMNKLKADTKNRDGVVSRDDCLEILIDVNNDKSSYYHFIVNSLGVIYDAQRRQGGNVKTNDWNALGIKVVVKKYFDNWIIEMAIPFVEFEIEPGNSGTWGFNIARARRTQKEFSSFMPMTGGFHQPGLFGNLVFKNLDLKPFFWKIKAPYSQKIVSVNGKIFLKNKLFITNNTGKFHFIKIKTKLFNCGKSQTVTTGLADNINKEIQINTPADNNGNTQLSVEITDRRTGERLATRLFPLNVQYAPLKIDLTQPFYRDCIFATQSIKELKGKIISDLNSLEKTELLLELKDSTGKVISSKIIKNPEGVNIFTLAIPDLKDGTYCFQVELQKNNEKLFSKQINVKKLPPFKGEVRIDENLITRVDGKPFLAYGWYSFGFKGFRQARLLGYNITVCAAAQSDVALKKYLDECNRNGLRVILYPYNRKFTRSEWGKPLSPDKATKIRNFVHKWKSHPAVFGWYMGDEPELFPALPALVSEVRKICIAEDPYHPCVMLNDSIHGIHKYIDGGDLFNPDPYPLFLKNKHSAKPIEKVGKFINEIAIAGKNRKTAWITPQGFNYGDAGRANNRAPNFIELRNMQYQAIIAGATGFIWWKFNISKPYPDIFWGVEFLGKEAKLLKNIILSPQKRIVLKTGDKYIKAVYYKNIDEGDWIIAVNNAVKIKNAKLCLPDQTPRKWYVVSEKRQIETNGEVLNDKFGIYDTNIYTTNQSIADKMSIIDIERKIKQEKTNRQRAGNLIQENNVKITVSSNSKSRCPLTHVFDGCRDALGWVSEKSSSSWLELDFAKKITFANVKVFSPTKGNMFVQIKRAGKWVDVAKLKSVAEGQLNVTFPAVTSSCLRIIFKGEKKKFQIYEIEVYKK